MKIEPGCQLRFYYTQESTEMAIRIISPDGKSIEWDAVKNLRTLPFLLLNKDGKSMDYLPARSFAKFLAELLAMINNLDTAQIIWINDPITYEFYAKNH